MGYSDCGPINYILFIYLFFFFFFYQNSLNSTQHASMIAAHQKNKHSQVHSIAYMFGASHIQGILMQPVNFPKAKHIGQV